MRSIAMFQKINMLSRRAIFKPTAASGVSLAGGALLGPYNPVRAAVTRGG